MMAVVCVLVLLVSFLTSTVWADRGYMQRRESVAPVRIGDTDPDPDCATDEGLASWALFDSGRPVMCQDVRPTISSGIGEPTAANCDEDGEAGNIYFQTNAEAPDAMQWICSGLLGWQPPAACLVSFKDEFGSGADNSAGRVSELNWGITAIGGATPTFQSAVGVWPNLGISRFNSGGAGAAQGAVFRHWQSGTDAQLGRLDQNVPWTLKVVFALTETTATRFYVGFGGQLTTTFPPADGIWLRYDTSAGFADTAFQACVRETSGAQFCTTTGVTADTSYHTLLIRSTTAGVFTFQVDDQPMVTRSSSIPSVGLSSAVWLVQDGATTRHVDMDYWRFWAFGGRCPTPPPAPPTDPGEPTASNCEGFGSGATGGEGKPTYTVTSLANSGTGTLRDALSQGNRYINSSVQGTINLTSDITIPETAQNITLAGEDSPGAGLTVSGRGFQVRGRNLILRELHFVNPTGADGTSNIGNAMSIKGRADALANDVCVRKVSVVGYTDSGFGVGDGAYNITFEYIASFDDGLVASGDTGHMLLFGGHNTTGQRVRRVTVRRALFAATGTTNASRMPQVKYRDTGTSGSASTELNADISNNLLWNWLNGGEGAQLWKRSRSNFVNNFLADLDGDDNTRKRGIYACKSGGASPQCTTSDTQFHALHYIAGNVGNGSCSGFASCGAYYNQLGTEGSRFAAPALTETDAASAACDVLASAGRLPRTSREQGVIDIIEASGVPSCP